MDEIDQLQRILVKNRVNVQTKVLQRAFMLPESFMQGGAHMPGEGRNYPTPAYGLMPPFDTDRQGKKKKKKKRVNSPVKN